MIRKIRASDNEELALIIRHTLKTYGLDRPGTVYTDPTTDNLFELFQRDGSVYFVATEGEKILGGCGIYPTKGLPEKHAELVKLYLREDARGKGLGYELFEKCLKWAGTQGYKHVYLETFEELSFAVKLYNKFGFRKLPEPLGDSGHHACEIWMLKDL